MTLSEWIKLKMTVSIGSPWSCSAIYFHPNAMCDHWSCSCSKTNSTGKVEKRKWLLNGKSVKLKRIRSTCATLYENVTMHSNHIHKLRMFTSVGDHLTVEHTDTPTAATWFYTILETDATIQCPSLARHEKCTCTCAQCVRVYSADDWTWVCLNFWFSSILYNTVTCALRLLMNAPRKT